MKVQFEAMSAKLGGDLHHVRAAFRPELSIVIPIYNGAGTLPLCLEAIQNAPGPTREIIVVDDGSDDESGAVARSFGVRTIRHNHNQGCGVARNTGVEQTSAPILVFVDADVVIHPDALLRISNFLAEHPDYAAVFGSYDAKPGDPSFVSQYRNLLHRFTHQKGKSDAETFWTGLGAVRRSAFQRVGGFNPKYRGIPDVTFGLDLSEAGFRIRLDHGLLCSHLKKWTLRKMVVTDVFLRARPWTLSILERRKMTNDLNTSTINRIGVLSASATIAFGAAATLVPELVTLMVLALIGNVVANIPVLRDFNNERGPVFAFGVAPLHFLHQLCATTGVAVGLMRCFVGTRIASDKTKLKRTTIDALGIHRPHRQRQLLTRAASQASDSKALSV